MSDATPAGWRRLERPPSLFRRFEFDGYAQTRAFLDALAALSQRTGLYSNLSFGRTYVNVTVLAGESGAIGSAETEFAAQAGACADEARRASG